MSEICHIKIWTNDYDEYRRMYKIIHTTMLSLKKREHEVIECTLLLKPCKNR